MPLRLIKEPVVLQMIMNQKLKLAFTSIECFYCKEYFQAIDLVKAALEKRFIQKNFLIAQKIEKCL